MPYEAYLTLTFSEPCLGNDRRPDPEPNKMLKSAEGKVIFPQAWWRSITGRAATAIMKHQERIFDVLWTPEIDGTIKLHKRFYGSDGAFKLHEAFERGDHIGVKALIPNDIPFDDFISILRLAGEYFGISPFGWRRGYGRFSILSAETK